MNRLENTKIGFLHNNPVLGLSLGLTTALAVTFSMTSAVGIGVLTFVLILAAALLGGLVKMVAPKEALLPVNIILVAFLAKIGELLVLAYAPGLATSVGIFLPLLAVNSVILFATGAFTPEASMGKSFAGALKAGVAYFAALVIVSFVRELLGTGGISLQNPLSGTEIFSFSLIPSEFTLSLFTQPAGALIVLALVAALFAAFGKQDAEMGGK
ncbi:Rnf-Nqr domain containing protein [Proteiniclasticum sp.]|uniref:Rnf-Nqr domain containing protein n=1 Tax=Proteiniclasticum sp. TaxID=2053595 RepID=UPI00289DF80B|nr:Rnf-Nqr domain containing protein [Proteiniclasticum sp.]